MVFTRLISTTFVISGLTGALAAPVEADALSVEAPSVLTTVPERTGDERRRMEDGEVDFAWDLTDEQKQMFVDRHNHWRNRAALGELNSGKKAYQMPQMYWDEELAQHAKKFSRKCIWEHSVYVGWREVDYGYGENLYATSSDQVDDRHIQSAMDNWAWEHNYYNHDSLSCSNEPCGHYTAMVWEHTTRVGCAVAKCNSITGISWSGHYVICQYYRGGNYRNTAPYQYSLTTGDGCSAAPYGDSTGMDSQWTGLCNNQNDICTENNRCSAMQTCSSGAPLNGRDTEYYCSAPACTYDEFPGYQVDNAYSYSNGMSEDGTWKYFYTRQLCEDWCYLNKDASPGCVGCTQQSHQPSSLWFAVRTVDESVRSARTHNDGSEMTLIVLDCSAPGVNPTAEPTTEPTSEPTFEPSAEPTSETTPSAPTPEPTAEPTSETTAPAPTAEPTHEPTVEVLPTHEPTFEPTVEEFNYECTTVTIQDVEMRDACAADTVIVVNGGWQLCRDTPDECIEWCKANRYTYNCVGVSSDDRNPGFFFPVRNVDVADRVAHTGGVLILMDCAPTGGPSGPPTTPTEEPTSEPTEEPAPTFEPTAEPTLEVEPTHEPTAEPTVEQFDYECTTVTIANTEMRDACAADTVIVVNGGWQLCRDTPDECIEWCKAHRYTHNCVGVSSDDRNPGFYFPVKNVDVADRVAHDGGVLILMDCAPTGNPTSPPASPTEDPTEEPTSEPTFEPTFEPSAEPTSEPTSEPTFEPTFEPSAEPTSEPTAEQTSEPTSEPTFEPSAEPTSEPTSEPTAEQTSEPTFEPTSEPTSETTTPPEQFTCTTVTIPNVEIRDARPSGNGLNSSSGGWMLCRDTPDACVEWCKENRFTAPCLGVTSDASNPNFYFPVKTIASEERESVEGGSLIVLNCDGGSFPPTPAPTNHPTAEGGAKFDIGSCDHLELTEGGNCVATKVYGNNIDCEITVLGDFVLDVRDWEVENHSTCRYDYLKLPSGDKFCTNSPQGQSVANGEKMEWHTDYSVTKDGWKMCASSRRRQGTPTEETAVLRRLE